MAKVRTHVHLDVDELDALRALARSRNAPVSRIVRELLRAALGLDRHRAELVDRFLSAAGAGRETDARRDVARRHDEVLHRARR